MEMKLARVQCDPDVTIGDLMIDGKHAAWVCEDTVRPANALKVFGQTAIPYGMYHIVITYSPHFKRDLPLLVDVPGFEGVRIHPGNTPEDTEGCLLPGLVRELKGVGQSVAAFSAIFPRIEAAIAAGERCTIEIY